MKTLSDEMKQFNLRLTDKQHQAIAQAASDNYRSMHAQIIVWIEEGLKRHQEADDA